MCLPYGGVAHRTERGYTVAVKIGPPFSVNRDMESPVDRPQKIRQFQLVELIGEGRYSQVYRALDTATQKAVAVKLYGRPEQETPDFLWKYLPRMEQLRGLEHPNLAVVRDVFEEDGRLVLIQDWAEGVPLWQALKTLPAPLERVLDLAKQLAAALDFLHNNSITHGNLKPSNILVDYDDRLRLTDAGLPRVRQETGDYLDNLGPEELATVSPEVLNGAQPTASSDLYQVGIIMYRLMTGHNPFAGETVEQLLEEMRRCKNVIGALRDVGIPGELVLLMHRLLACKKSDRCQSAQELAITLSSIDEFERELPRQESGKRHLPPRIYLIFSALAILLLIVWIAVTYNR